MTKWITLCAALFALQLGCEEARDKKASDVTGNSQGVPAGSAPTVRNPSQSAVDAGFGGGPAPSAAPSVEAR